MSRPRSRSPHHRASPKRHGSTREGSWSFHWDKPDFPSKDPDKYPVLRSPQSREDFKESRPNLRGDAHQRSCRGSPPLPDGHQQGCQPRNAEEWSQGIHSPHHSEIGYTKRRLSPRPLRGDGDRNRGTFSNRFQSFDRRGRSPDSPFKERSPVLSWSRAQRGRSRVWSIDMDLRQRSEEHREGMGKRRRRTPSQERQPPHEKQKRGLEDTAAYGFGPKEEFRRPLGQGCEGDARGGLSREGFSRGNRARSGSRMGDRDYDRERFDPDTDFVRRGGPHHRGSPQEGLRRPHYNSFGRGNTREKHFTGPWRSSAAERRRSPVEHVGRSPENFLKRDAPMSLMKRGGPNPPTGRFGGDFGKHPAARYHRNHQQRYSPGPPDGVYQDPSGQQRHSEERWNHGQTGGLNYRGPAIKDLGSKGPHQKSHGWTKQDPEDTAEETLTIKVDMSRPVRTNSQLHYSTDRQLSMDLVSVGRQRLDFLPEQPRSREGSTPMGTFAQEIITLVHQVKEQYFRGKALTLNERFSASEEAGSHSDGQEEMTLNERFSSQRGLSVKVNMPTEEEPLGSRLGPAQPLLPQPIRGPGDLRHDLEKRRQERLEGVKVTIPGSNQLQCSLSPTNKSSHSFGDVTPQESAGLPSWRAERGSRGGFIQGPNRGFRPNAGPPQRMLHFGRQPAPHRLHNKFHRTEGPAW